MSFKFASVGHFLASAAHDAKVAVKFLVAHQAQAETAVAVVSALDPSLAPLASTIERAGEALLGDALAVISNLDAASAAKGASVTLDAATVASLKQLLSDIQKAQPAAANVPAGLPLTAAS